MTFAEPPSFLGGRGTPPAQKQLTPAEEMRIYCGVMSDPGAAAEQEDKNMEIEQEPMRTSHPLEERPAKTQKGPNQGKAGSIRGRARTKATTSDASSLDSTQTETSRRAVPILATSRPSYDRCTVCFRVSVAFFSVTKTP